MQNKLPWMMLAALEQVLIQSRKEPIEKTKAIAAILAYLYSLKSCERWPFDEFWRSLDQEDAIMRSSNLNRCINGICLQAGIERVPSLRAGFE